MLFFFSKTFSNKDYVFLFKVTGGAPGIILSALCKNKFIFVISENQESVQRPIVPG